MYNEPVNTIILSAGLSSRMAQPKALLRFGSTTFLENIYSEFSKVSDRVVVVVSPHLYYKLKEKQILQDAEFVFNQRLIYGRFYSVYLGVKKLGPGNTFIQNVDTPGVRHATLSQMIKVLESEAYVVPVYKGQSGHPVLISSEISRQILEVKDNYEAMNLKNFLEQFKRIELEVDDEFVVLNVNTPSDLDLLHSKLSSLRIDHIT